MNINNFFKDISNRYSTLGDYIENEQQPDNFKHLLDFNQLFNYPPNQLFEKLTFTRRLKLEEYIQNIDLKELENQSPEIKEKAYKWIKDYIAYKELRKHPHSPKRSSNTNQQIVLFFMLIERIYGKKVDQIHQDNAKVAKVLAVLFNRGYDNVYIKYNDYKDGNITDFHSVNNIEILADTFDKIGRKDIAEELRAKRTSTLKKKFKHDKL